MLKFYFNGSPNPTKVALFLEEAALPYEAIPVDTRKGDQFKPAFAAWLVAGASLLTTLKCPCMPGWKKHRNA